MEQIKHFIEENLEMEYIEYSYDETDYLLTTSFAIMKYKESYLISFCISIDKKLAFDFYMDFGQHFLGEIDFKIHDDCIIKVNPFSKELEYFCFGVEAKRMYFSEIVRDIEVQNSIPKETIFH